jgi:hypothetical protein
VLFVRWKHYFCILSVPLKGVEEFKYLGTTLTNQTSTQEETKRRLKSGNACYRSAQNVLSSSLLSRNMKIHITIILPFCVGVQLGRSPASSVASY